MSRPAREEPAAAFSIEGRPQRPPPPGFASPSISDYSREKEDVPDSPSLPILPHQNVSFREDAHPLHGGQAPQPPNSSDLVRRKKSLVRPERQPLDVNSP